MTKTIKDEKKFKNVTWLESRRVKENQDRVFKEQPNKVFKKGEEK